MSEEELSYWEWLLKVDERLHISILSIRDHKDLSEHDWGVLEYFHKLHWLGELPFYKTVPDLKEEVSHEQNLFSAIQSVSQEGIVFDTAK